MPSTEYILKVKGADWKHRTVSDLALGKEFPMRLRIINLLRKVWGLDLLKMTTPSGVKLALDVNDWVQYQIYYYGVYEKKSIALFNALSVNSDVVFDIGAHIGQYAFESAIVDTDRTKQIFAIEVNPKTFTHLLNNIQLNNFTNVKAVLGAVSSAEGLLNINMPAYWNMGNTQIDETVAANDLNNYLAASFDITRLLNKYKIKHINLVKIDVEGHEYEVLNSLFKINVYPKHIIFEYIPDAFAGSSATIALLETNGYLIKDINGNKFSDTNEVIEYNLWAQKL